MASSPDYDAGCRFIWTTDEKPTRRCLTHEYDWRPPYEPICPGRVTPPAAWDAPDPDDPPSTRDQDPMWGHDVGAP